MYTYACTHTSSSPPPSSSLLCQVSKQRTRHNSHLHIMHSNSCVRDKDIVSALLWILTKRHFSLHMLSLLRSRFSQGALQKSRVWDPRRVFWVIMAKKTLLFNQKKWWDLFDDGRPGKGAGEGEGQKKKEHMQRKCAHKLWECFNCVCGLGLW